MINRYFKKGNIHDKNQTNERISSSDEEIEDEWGENFKDWDEILNERRVAVLSSEVDFK